MNSIRRGEFWQRWGVLLLPAVIVTSLCSLRIAVSSPASEQSGAWSALDASLALISGGALLARRRAPFCVLGVELALSVLYQACGGALDATLPATEVALYTVALSTGRVTAWATAGLVASWALVTTVAFQSGPWFGPQRIGVVAWIAAAVAIGDAVRSRRAVVAALQERAERAERTRAEEAARRVAEERVRIARDLHDVVAHQLTLIHAQAGVGVYLSESGGQPDAGLLPRIRDGAKAALEELRDLVGVLAPLDGDDVPYTPTPRLEGLPDLIVSFQHAGLEIEFQQRGTPIPLPTSVDVAAYRIAQEALTNVQKHAGVDQARVELDWDQDFLRLRVINGRAARDLGGSVPGCGRGSVSIKERAAALGGSARLTRHDDGFLVEAELPYRAALQQRSSQEPQVNT
ncbi:sensor histidine kinase [Streptomyces sp. NPDC091972]|uniref:sensor histidine kinase n=1 Tax=Streptomyces sp. NPDC091972 TaxID=3366007 RepID=UPI0038132B51